MFYLPVHSSYLFVIVYAMSQKQFLFDPSVVWLLSYEIRIMQYIVADTWKMVLSACHVSMLHNALHEKCSQDLITRNFPFINQNSLGQSILFLGLHTSQATIE